MICLRKKIVKYKFWGKKVKLFLKTLIIKSLCFNILLNLTALPQRKTNPKKLNKNIKRCLNLLRKNLFKAILSTSQRIIAQKYKKTWQRRIIKCKYKASN